VEDVAQAGRENLDENEDEDYSALERFALSPHKALVNITQGLGHNRMDITLSRMADGTLNGLPDVKLLSTPKT
jgi:hypothetical protein